MSEFPPRFDDHLFQELDRPRPELTPFMQELYEFLNETSCLRDLQKIRRMAGKHPKYPVAAFVLPANSVERELSYIFHKGGRNEMQFNIGMFGQSAETSFLDRPYTPYVRVGCAFDFTKAAFGNPEAVEEAFSSFREVVGQRRTEFERFVTQNELGIESFQKYGKDYITWTQPREARELTTWLLRTPFPHHDWIFVGRRLLRGTDRATLEEPRRFKQVIESVFSGFKPFWEQTEFARDSQ